MSESSTGVYIITQALRRMIYGVLLKGHPNTASTITEFLQVKKSFKIFKVQATLGTELLSYTDLMSASVEVKLLTFLQLMRSDDIQTSVHKLTPEQIIFLTAIRNIPSDSVVAWHIDALILLFLSCVYHHYPALSKYVTKPTPKAVHLGTLYQVLLVCVITSISYVGKGPRSHGQCSVCISPQVRFTSRALL